MFENRTGKTKMKTAVAKKAGTLERAVAIAAMVHEGQTDKAGAAYLLHPIRLMMKMRETGTAKRRFGIEQIYALL